MTRAAIGRGRAIALALAGANVMASDMDEEADMQTAPEAGGRMSLVRAGMRFSMMSGV